MIVAQWPDREAFERAFYDADMQAGMRANLDELADPVFLISEVLAQSVNEQA